MMHLFPRDRALVAACVVPIMQHMFVLVKYHAHTAYLIIELVLEGWFQWEVMSNITAFHSHFGLDITRIGRGMAMTMLFAHWLYVSGSVLHMLDGVLSKDDSGKKDPNETSEEWPRREPTAGRSIAKMNTVKQFFASSEVLSEIPPARSENNPSAHEFCEA